MEKEQKLGMRVFCYYFYKKILLGIVLLVISIIALSFKDSMIPKLTFIFSASMANQIINSLIMGLFLISFLALIGGVFLTWLNYINHTFILGDLSFVIKRGIFSKRTISIPYKQIQDISIEQSFSHRIMGVCKMTILTAGNDENDKEGEAEGVFNIIDINVAKNIQSAILEKNNIHKL